MTPRIFQFLPASLLAVLLTAEAQAVLVGTNNSGDSRLAPWSAGTSVGVPGGIPYLTNIVDITKAPYNADSTGTTDCHDALLAAINNAIPGEVIFLPAGTYLVNETIFPNQGKSNYTIRGTGDTTVIKWLGTGGELFYLGSGSDYQWNYPTGGVAITGGLTQGSTVLTVASTSAVIDGGIIQIAENNDATLPVFHVAGYQKQRTQKARVVSHTATTITISPGLLWTLQSGLSPVFNVAQFQSNGVGIEDLFIDDHLSTASFVLLFEQCYGSWIYNVHSQLAYNYHIYLVDCLQCQVDHCFLDQLNHAGTNGGCLIMQGTSNSLIQNNIIVKGVPHMEINFACSGNVFAYNFCYDSTSFGVVGPSLDTNHGPHNSYNLYEGNIAPNIQCDGFFGSASEDTVFRNWLFGTAPAVFEPGSSSGPLAAREPILLQRFTRNYNVIGNLLGTEGDPYYSIDSTVATGSPYSFGLPNLGNPSSTGTASLLNNEPWADWNMTGTVASGGGTTNGTITVTSGTLGDWSSNFSGNGPNSTNLIWSGGQATVTGATSGSGTTLTLATLSNLPSSGTSVALYAGSGGYQEKDLDVQATLDLKANYDVFNQLEPSADQALGADTLPNSFYLTAAPPWFGTLAWPAINAQSPYTSSITSGAIDSAGGLVNGRLPTGFETIPAGYRYVYGVDPPTAPYFIGQPAGTTILSGTTTTFTVAVLGGPAPALQWYVNTGSGWTLLSNAGVYSGVTTSALTIAGAPLSYNGYQYECIATNSTAPGAATSTSALLTVTPSPPTITSALTAAGHQNTALSYSITGTNLPTSYNATGLPNGLSVNTTTGAITGTPTGVGASNITISATNSGGTGTATLVLTVGAGFTVAPSSQTVATGRSVAFNAPATGATHYQWMLNGSTTIPGATGATDSVLLVSGATASDAGAYTCTATISGGSITTNPATLAVVTTSTPGYIDNLSARALVGTGGSIVITGFGISGSGSMDLLLRGVGPTLAGSPYNVAGTLSTPQLTLYDTTPSPGPYPIVTDTRWGSSLTQGTSSVHVSPQAATVTLMNTVGAFLLNSGSADSAMEVTPPVGSYTAQVSGLNGNTGVVLAEIYDADAYTATRGLVNISTRANVGVGGNIVIGGFEIGGSTAETVLVRAVGPTLALSPYNLVGTIAQPVLTIVSSSSGATLYTNTGWGGDSTIASAIATVGAFALNASSQDSALLITLPPGGYTAQVSGVGGGTGIALAEVYEVH